MPITNLSSPAKIEEELTRIWDGLKKSGKIRASLFNLVVIAKKNEREEYLRSTISKTVEKFPSRVLFFLLNETETAASLKSSVSLCFSQDLHKQFACDYIEFEVGKESQPLIPFLLFPHLLPDLPIYLVWGENLCKENPVAPELERIASRLILDSETATDLFHFAQTALSHHRSSHIDLADLNWARLESWRDLLSSTFATEDYLRHLQQANSIDIVYNGHESAYFSQTQIQAIYLQAWLACQLGWRFHSVSKTSQQLQFLYYREKNPITITLRRETQPHLSPGNILSFELHAEESAHLRLHRDLAIPNQITFEMSTQQSCLLPTRFVFAKGEAGQSLVKEISHKGTSEHYIKVLQFLASLGETGV